MRPMSSALASYARVAARAARQAGALLARRVNQPKRVSTKRSRIDLVTDADRAAERLIYKMLRRAAPTIDFFGEEQGQRSHGSSCRWIVDPLDGTNNFVHSLPIFGVSIGLECDGELAVGVIYDPMRRELFSAIKGGGAFLNGRRIRVSSTPRLAESLLSTGFSSRFSKSPQLYLKWFERFQAGSHGVRRIGSTVYCLAAIAAGRLEGFYEQDLWPWDIAAGIVIVQEAGGRISGFDGHTPRLTDGRLVASNGRIHAQMLRVLKTS